MNSNPFSLEGKFIAAFGGAGYLGSATVTTMLNLGARVLVADLFPAYSRKQVERLETHPHCVLQSCDIASTEQVRSAYQRCLDEFGALNAVVNFALYAAPLSTASSSLEQTADEVFDYSVQGTLGSSFRIIREAVPFLQHNVPSCIVNTASMYGLISPDPGIYGDSGQNNPVYYGAAKAGVLQLTRYAAAHLAKKQIRVNCVSPGPFPDPRKLPPEDFLAKLAAKTMLGRIGKCEEIAGAYCYLLSEAASFMTGANIVVDGGWTAW